MALEHSLLPKGKTDSPLSLNTRLILPICTDRRFFGQYVSPYLLPPALVPPLITPTQVMKGWPLLLVSVQPSHLVRRMSRKGRCWPGLASAV